MIGEKLEDAQVDELVKDCMDPEDDDGMIPYARKYSKMKLVKPKKGFLPDF